jgi:hypothetical protein
VRAVERRLRVLQRHPEHCREIGHRQLMPNTQLQDLPRDGRERQHRLPRRDALVDVLLVVAGDGHIRRLSPGRQAPGALQPGDGVEPRSEPVGVAQPGDVRLCHDEGVA